MKSQLSIFFRIGFLLAAAAFPAMVVSGLPFGGGIADCSSESAFAVVGRDGESQIVESGEPPMTAAEAVEAMEAGDWIEDEMAKTRGRLAAWLGNDEAVLVAFETDLHVFSPVRGRWKNRAALIAEGNFRHVKRFARVANAFGVGGEKGDL